MSSLLIGISGGSCSGKTTLATNLLYLLGADDCAVLSMDQYYKSGSEDDAPLTRNFDAPSALDLDRFVNHIELLAQGHSVSVPIYDRGASQVTGTTSVAPRPILVVEGLFIFLCERLLGRFPIRVFLDSDATVRRTRRLLRDTISYGVPAATARSYYERYVIPCDALITEVARSRANLIIGDCSPEQSTNAVLRNVSTVQGYPEASLIASNARGIT